MSKVAMSVCALVVAGMLSGVVDRALVGGPGGDLEEVLRSFERTLLSATAAGCDASVGWMVPELPSGTAVDVSIEKGSVSAIAGGVTRAVEPRPAPHTWAWDGGPVNSSQIEQLDLEGPRVSACSGDVLVILALRALVDNGPALLVFVREA